MLKMAELELKQDHIFVDVRVGKALFPNVFSVPLYLIKKGTRPSVVEEYFLIEVDFTCSKPKPYVLINTTSTYP
jgi:hypothetical protein